MIFTFLIYLLSYINTYDIVFIVNYIRFLNINCYSYCKSLLQTHLSNLEKNEEAKSD